MPVFSHDETDIPNFRMITSQFYVNGNATQAQIIKAFGIPPISIKRAVKLLSKSSLSYDEIEVKNGKRIEILYT